MRTFKVRYRREALADLQRIEDFIARRSGLAVAQGFVDRLVTACEALATAPERGTLRRNLPHGVRLVGVERAATVAFTVDAEAGHVMILGVFYRGRDVATQIKRRRR
jgi:toxin ParE1/3/4